MRRRGCSCLLRGAALDGCAVSFALQVALKGSVTVGSDVAHTADATGGWYLHVEELRGGRGGERKMGFGGACGSVGGCEEERRKRGWGGKGGGCREDALKGGREAQCAKGERKGKPRKGTHKKP